MLRKEDVFTTGDVSRICGLSQQTIIRCFDTGKLDGYRVPGSKFRRIPRANLLKFMRENGIPMDKLDSGKKRVIIIDDDPDIIDLLTEVLVKSRFEIRVVSDGFEAGAMTQSFRPHLLLLDYILPCVNAGLICKFIKNDPELANTKIIVISGIVDDHKIRRLLASGVKNFVKKPFSADKISSEIINVLQGE